MNGVAINGVANAKDVAVKLRNSAGTFRVVLAAACSRGDNLYGAASGQDILALAARIEEDVFRLFRMKLEKEVNVI